MSVFQLFQLVSPFISIAAVIVGTLVYLWAQAKNGTAQADEKKDKVASQVIATYEARIKQLEELAAEQKLALDAERKASQDDRNELAKQIGELRGELKAKDEQIKILQGRNPEIEDIIRKLGEYLTGNNPATMAANEYMLSGREFMKTAHEYMTVSLPILKELKDYIEQGKK